MKNILIPAALVLVAALTAVPSHAQVVVINGDFESGNTGTPNSGSVTGWGATTSPTTAAALAGGGTTAATIQTGAFALLAQTTGAAATTGSVPFSFDAALLAGNAPVSDTTGTNEGSTLLFRVEDAGPVSGQFQDFYVSSQELNTSTYTDITGSFNVFAGDTYRIDFYGFVQQGSSVNGTYLVDNVVVGAVPEPSSYALMLAGCIVLLGGGRLMRKSS